MNKKSIIHFAHGNGFPSQCYQQLFNGLNSYYDICFIDRLGHNTDFPITENWQYLVDEVIDSIVSQCKEPVIGLGHSLGGVLTLLASYRRPELFKKVVLLDAPIFGFAKSSLIKLAKQLGLITVLTPAEKISNRINEWGSLKELRSYLLSKPFYKNFNEQCLNDYIKFGMIKTGLDKHQLKFERERESLIFKTVPHNMYRYSFKQKVPVVLIYGVSSNIITTQVLRTMIKKYYVATAVCSGSHMFPLEFPKEAAKLIVSNLK